MDLFNILNQLNSLTAVRSSSEPNWGTGFMVAQTAERANSTQVPSGSGPNIDLP